MRFRLALAVLAQLSGALVACADAPGSTSTEGGEAGEAGHGDGSEVAGGAGGAGLPEELPAGQGGDGPASGAGGQASPPRLLSSEPPLGAVDVYPAPLWNGNGEELRLELRFSAAMRQRADLVLEGDARPRTLRSAWSDDRTLLSLTLLPELGSSRLLEDETEYAVDLDPLRDDAGASLEPDLGLEAGRLRFSTGRYDPLLNHSCGHTFFGPFASVAATPAPQDATADIGITHTQYTIALPDEVGGHGGWVKARFAVEAPHRLYFDAFTPVVVARGAGEPVQLEPAATPKACPGITHEITLSPPLGDDLRIFLGPQATPLRRVIVELVP